MVHEISPVSTKLNCDDKLTAFCCVKFMHSFLKTNRFAEFSINSFAIGLDYDPELRQSDAMFRMLGSPFQFRIFSGFLQLYGIVVWIALSSKLSNGLMCSSSPNKIMTNHAKINTSAAPLRSSSSYFGVCSPVYKLCSQLTSMSSK